MTHLDTSFLVDLLREQRRNRFGPASEYLETLPDHEVLVASVHVVCELMAGAHAPGAPPGDAARISRLCDSLAISYPDDRFAGVYGRLLAGLRAAGVSVDTMDLLIATAAVLEEAPLVTGNARHFAKVPGLRVVGY